MLVRNRNSEKGNYAVTTESEKARRKKILVMMFLGENEKEMDTKIKGYNDTAGGAEREMER